MPTLADLAVRINQLLLHPPRMQKIRELAMGCLCEDVGHIDTLQFPKDPDNPHDFTLESLSRERGNEPYAVLTPGQTALVIAALHDAHCHNVEPVLTITGPGNPQEFTANPEAWAKYRVDFGTWRRWRIILDHVRAIGEYSVNWFTLQMQRFEFLIREWSKDDRGDDALAGSNSTESMPTGARSEPTEPTGEARQIKPKRSTERGEGRVKLIAALTKHHQYADGGCLNLEPVGNNELARLAGVAKRTASAFFDKEFQGHAKYRALCCDAGKLVAALKLLNGEFSPHLLYGDAPSAKSGTDADSNDE